MYVYDGVYVYIVYDIDVKFRIIWLIFVIDYIRVNFIVIWLKFYLECNLIIVILYCNIINEVYL